MASKYSPPEWSAPPKYECSLEVIKDGAVVDTIDLSTRAYFLVGALFAAPASTDCCNATDRRPRCQCGAHSHGPRNNLETACSTSI